MTSARVVPSNIILGQEEFSTPPSTPGPSTINPKQGHWKPPTALTNIDVPMLNCPISPPMLAEEDSLSSARSQQQPPQLQKITSPCFVHSHLDKGMMLADWLKTKHHPAGINDVGLAKSLQSPGYNGHNNSTLHPSAISDLDRGFGTDEDESGNNLTKRLAKTAVTVREMSKQLGMSFGN
jgi:NAD+ kinase